MALITSNVLKSRPRSQGGATLEVSPVIEAAHVEFLSDWAEVLGRLQFGAMSDIRVALTRQQIARGTFRPDAMWVDQGPGDDPVLGPVQTILDGIEDAYSAALDTRETTNLRVSVGIEVGMEQTTGVSWVQNITDIVGSQAGLTETESAQLANFVIVNEPDVPKRMRRVWINRQLDLISANKLVNLGLNKGGVTETISGRSMKLMRTAIRQGILKGTRVESIMDRLADIPGITHRRAEFLARDQVLTHSARMNHSRHNGIGVTHYYWETVGDGRVRLTHRERSTKRYSYAEGPPNGENPGIEPQCRCWASPDLTGALKNLQKITLAEQRQLLNNRDSLRVIPIRIRRRVILPSRRIAA